MIVDVAQYINVSQVINNASREGAYVAARPTTTSVDEVEDLINEYLLDVLHVSDSDNIQIVLKEGDEPIEGDQLSDVAEGTQLEVQVSFDFDSIRWLPGLVYWSGEAAKCNTTFRKQ